MGGSDVNPETEKLAADNAPPPAQDSKPAPHQEVKPASPAAKPRYVRAVVPAVVYISFLVAMCFVAYQVRLCLTKPRPVRLPSAFEGQASHRAAGAEPAVDGRAAGRSAGIGSVGHGSV